MLASRYARRDRIGAALVFAAIVQSPQARAEITSGGGAIPSTGGEYTIGESLGLVRGSNLFHSFGKFNLDVGETARFTGPSAIANILSRVSPVETRVLRSLRNPALRSPATRQPTTPPQTALWRNPR